MPRGTTPIQVAERIEANVDAATAAFPELTFPIRTNSVELADTHSDIWLMSELGRYYAAKIRGATELALFRATRDTKHQQLAVKHLKTAEHAWSGYAEKVGNAYGPSFWTNRVGRVDWQQLTAEVRRDIEIAQAPLR